MESYPNYTIDELVQFLKFTFSGVNEEVQAASKIFSQLSQNITQLFDSLLLIVMHERTDQEFTRIKNAACLVMNSHVPLIFRSQNISLETKSYLANAVITTMSLDSINLPLKLTLLSTLKALYHLDTSSHLRNQGLQFVKEKLSSESVNDYAATLLVFQALINCPDTTKQAVIEWFLGLRKLLMACGNNIVNGIVTEIEDLASGNANQEEKTKTIWVGLKVLNFWVTMVSDIFKMLRKQDIQARLIVQFIEVIVGDEHLVKIYSNILTIQVPSNKQIEQCLFSTSGIAEIDESLNEIKTIVLKDFNYFLEVVNSSESYQSLYQTQFYQFIENNGIKGVLNSVFVFCKSDTISIEEALQGLSFNHCVVECLIFLTRLTKHERLNPLFSDYKKQLILDVCLPLIQSTAAEHILFQKDPSQFVYLALDTCYEQESKTVKTQAVQLLEHVCKDINGTQTYIVRLLVNIIHYSISSDNQEDLPLKYEALDPRAKFITQTDARIRVETSLLALSVIDYLISARTDLMDMIEKMVTELQESLFGEWAGPFLKSRVCLFIEHYLDILFQKEEDDHQEMFRNLLKFVVLCISLDDPSNGALSEQAITTLSYIFKQAELQVKLSPFISDILGELINYAEFVRSTKFFEILEEIVKNHSQYMREQPLLLGGFIQVLVKRVQIEYEKSKQKANYNKLLIYKIWHIFNRIAENKLYLFHFQDEIENILSPLFGYLSTDQNVPFEEQCLTFMCSTIRIQKKVSDASWEIFKAFPVIFQKTEMISSLMFKALNLVVIYGTETLQKDVTAVKTLIEMGVHTLSFSCTQDNKFDLCKGALFLQLIIQYLGDISDEDWDQIIGACVEMLSQVSQDFIKTKLGGVILCMFFTKFNLTQTCLNNRGALGNVLDLFLLEPVSFEGNVYDRKLLIIGLCSFLGQANLIPEVYERIPQILEVLVSLLKYIQFTDEKKRKERINNPEAEEEPSSNKKNIKVLRRFLNDEESKKMFEEKEEGINNENDFDPTYEDEEEKSEDDDGDNENSEADSDESSNRDFFSDYVDLTETNKIVDNMETGLKQKDEFVCFREYFMKMKDLDPRHTLEIVESLPKEKKHFLKDTLQSQRVVVNSNEGKTEARRIVKPKQRKLTSNIEL